MNGASSKNLMIVIVNYRMADLTIECLRSLESEVRSCEGVKVIVTDNDSGDGSIQELSVAIEREGWGDWASCMPLPRNGGFSYGNNRAIEVGLAGSAPFEFFLFLNPDTKVYPGAIKTLIDFIRRHPNIGIAGPRLEWPDGSLIGTAHNAPTPLRELDRAAEIGLVSGWFGARSACLRLGSASQ